MGMIELLIPIVSQLVRFDLHGSFCFYRNLHLGNLRMGGMEKGRAKNKEEDKETQDKAVISQDLSLGRK
jgi:hypothetical protein